MTLDINKEFETRIERLQKIRTDPDLLAALKVFYRDNPIQFIEDWGMTYDPRNTGDNPPALMPFKLFPRQKEFCEWVLARLEAKETGLMEKSRDVGATWLAISLACTLCIFRQNFQVGFGSRKEIYVDAAGDPKSIFWKGRTFVQFLPPEFRAGWNLGTSPNMRLGFPETGSVITGEAGDNIGRGDRAAVYFVDEAAFLERPALVESSLSATTDCRIDMSSVNGRSNPFAEKRFSLPSHQVFTFHWRDDPRKDDKWYAKKCGELSPVVVAQEIDLDYSASVEGVLIPSAWVQAAIGAHTKLGITPTGSRIAGLDVADEGRDKCALAGRYGILLEQMEEWTGKNSDLYETTVRAMNHADDWGVESLFYDADGLGSNVKGDSRKINEARKAENLKPIKVSPHRGSGEIHDPDGEMVRDRKNKDFFRNFKAQSWWALRLRFERTYLAVTQGEEIDPDKLISIDPALPLLSKLSMELSQATYKLNETGKVVVNKSPDGAKSPNLADAVVIAYAPHSTGLSINPIALSRIINNGR